MRGLYLAGAAVGLLLVVDAGVVGFSGPTARLAWLGLFAYGWFLACLVALVVALRRGEPPWFFVAFLAYSLADAVYGFYLAARFPDPSQLRIPLGVVIAHAAFGLAYAVWGLHLGARRGGEVSQ